MNVCIVFTLSFRTWGVKWLSVRNSRIIQKFWNFTVLLSFKCVHTVQPILPHANHFLIPLLSHHFFHFILLQFQQCPSSQCKSPHSQSQRKFCTVTDANFDSSSCSFQIPFLKFQSFKQEKANPKFEIMTPGFWVD